MDLPCQIRNLIEALAPDEEEPYTLHKQCAWCRLMLSGPYAGQKMDTLIKQDCSHGMCEQCALNIYAHYQQVTKVI